VHSVLTHCLLTGTVHSVLTHCLQGLSPTDIKTAVAAVSKAGMNNCDGSCGGANTADMATITLQLGLVTGSSATVSSALTRLYGGLAVVAQPAEGIQADSSFHQHGAEELTGSYGAVFTNRMLQVYQLTANTSLTMPPDKLATFASLLLDGQQWVTTASGDWALAVIGRSISSPGRHRVGFSAAALRSLPVRRDEMGAFASVLEESGANRAGSAGVIGNRHYWDSDTMVHRRAGFVLVVRMRSKRTVAARCINGACLNAQHVADGSIQLYPTEAAATRYLDMPAVWDWHAVPGVTAPTGTTFLACDPKKSEAIGYQWPLLMGGAKFVGGASDGECGATAMQFGATGLLKNAGFTLSRSHFAFDGAFVLLGAGLRSIGSSLRVATTLANERLSGSVVMDDVGGSTGQTVLAPVRPATSQSRSLICCTIGTATTKMLSYWLR
jgi:chondroitin AC lyase